MPGYYYSALLSVFLALITLSCSSQNKESTMNTHDRKPAVAGLFYPADSLSLRQMLSELFQEAPGRDHMSPAALIVPHAGYVFSGKVAAAAYNQLDPQSDYETLFILGPSHKASFRGASVFTGGDYFTPLGRVKVDTELAQKLARENSLFSFVPHADLPEHDIEVQLPFLQYHLKKDFKILPVIIGTDDPDILRQIATALKPYFRKGNLFIISTDFSHYPGFEDAVKTDEATAKAIISNDPDTLRETLEANRKKNIPGLATSLCGTPAVMSLLYITENLPGITLSMLDYQNSGHSPHGDRYHVVGYCALRVDYDNHSHSLLSEREKEQLLALAREAIQNRLRPGHDPRKMHSDREMEITLKCGAFVSLHKKGDLRGCIGYFGEDRPLVSVVEEMAVAAAFRDSRFEPLRPDELEEVVIEISVLTPMKKIQRLDEIQLGQHGIYIRKGSRSGTFLPQVAVQTGWSLEDFLGHCSRDKAGLGWDGWKEAEIFTYEAVVFEENKKK